MRAVNLLPEQDRPGGMPTVLTTTSVAAGGGALLAAVILFMGISFVQSHNKVSDRSDTLNALEQQVAQVQAAAARSAAQQGVDQSRVTAFTTAASSRMAWDELLDDISRVLPAGSWLSSLNMQAGAAAPVPGSTTAAVPTSFTVTGLAFTQNIVAEVMQRLELVPALAGVTLQSSSKTAVGTAGAYQFSMSASVLPPEVPR